MNRRRIQVRFPQRESCFFLQAKMMKPRIMIVDDDSAIRDMLSRILIEEGYLALPAANGQEALDLAAATRVDLVLLDLNLPIKNGWDIFERLTNENPLLPIIIITARSNQLMTTLAAGAGALMEKPLDFHKLLHTIRALLDEPTETRLARIAGRETDFHYGPSREPTK
jgi:DNA-binding response OmpR family regulator